MPPGIHDETSDLSCNAMRCKTVLLALHMMLRHRAMILQLHHVTMIITGSSCQLPCVCQSTPSPRLSQQGGMLGDLLCGCCCPSCSEVHSLPCHAHVSSVSCQCIHNSVCHSEVSCSTCAPLVCYYCSLVPDAQRGSCKVEVCPAGRQCHCWCRTWTGCRALSRKTLLKTRRLCLKDLLRM